MRSPVFQTLQQALQLHQQGKLDAAEALYRSVLRDDDRQADAWHLLGGIQMQRGDPAAAVHLIGRAVTLAPWRADFYGNLGAAWGAQDRHAEALRHFDQAIALAPETAEFHLQRATALASLQRGRDALASYDRALALGAATPELFCDRGNALQTLNRHAEAVADYDRALALRPDFALAFSNRANAYAVLNRMDLAIEGYDRALALQPDLPFARLNRAYALLRLGDYRRGWPDYELRWTDPNIARGLPALDAPQWDGSAPVAGRTLLLRGEQGLGDMLQFCRYAPLLAARGATIILDVPAPLVRLLARLDGVTQVIAHGSAPPAFDWHIPLMSLPLAFGTTLESVPPAPYLVADAQRSAVWAARLAALPGRKVGLCWAGRRRSDVAELGAVDRRRSMPRAALAPLAAVAGVSFVSLQKMVPAGDAAGGPPMHDYTAELADFDDTAALVSALDLVITVDTAVAHLAGGLGKPVWILNRFDACWRWLMDRDDSPWYPSARLFRQPVAGDWGSVAGEVVEMLQTGLGQTNR
jgi:tetratricopeptide (TPR) repeat protein